MKLKNLKKYKEALTLVELLLVITIIVIFAGVSLAYYNNFTEEKKLETETQKLFDVLELAKKKASSGDFGSFSCGNFSGYQVSIQSSSYQLKLCCSSNCTSNYQIQNYNFSTNISVIGGTGDIQFKQLTSGINSTTPITITVKNNNLNKCRQITISPVGIIESSTNSTSC